MTKVSPTAARLLGILQAAEGPMSRTELIEALYHGQTSPLTAATAVGVYLTQLRSSGHSIIGKPWAGVQLAKMGDADGAKRIQAKTGARHVRTRKRGQIERKCLCCRDTFTTREDYRLCDPCRQDAAETDGLMAGFDCGQKVRAPHHDA